ncbi:MAG: serine/threonine-protein kinase [Chloroflexota bacterium]
MSIDPLLGRQVANFRLDHLIGRGGMASVYFGWDVKLNRPVAIKMIDARYRDNPTYAERFVREAQMVATWRHEHIIQIHYADDEDGLYYFVMEFINGLDLGKLVSQYEKENELVPHDDVVRIGEAVASALDYAHEQGVVHRDVKPTNVMLSDDGRVVLTDFGIALESAQSSMGEVVGTAHYIAPEQARSSSEAVPQSDLYALAVILYQLLTGSLPFNDPSPTTLALQHVTHPPPHPTKINPHLNKQTETVLLKALSKSAGGRYQSGADLMAALKTALGAEPTDTPIIIPKFGGSKKLSHISVTERVAHHIVSRVKSPATKPITIFEGRSLLGHRLDEYRLDSVLGQGGMAHVYRGLDTRLKRFVAIKVINSPFRGDSDYVRRFEREAQAIAQLEHPHIVRLYRYGESDGVLYMAMQYIEGSNLDKLLEDYTERNASIPFETVARIIREVCLAVDFAHRRGIIHRDIKPSNIMLDKQNIAILADFGLALLTEFGTQGEIFGSPHYVAPEQAMSSANVVPQSDLYAIGVILYQMITGELPFQAEGALDLALMHMSSPPRSPQELRDQVSADLEAVILQALAKDPEERFQSGAALADALDAALNMPQNSSHQESQDVKVDVPLAPDSGQASLLPFSDQNADVTLDSDTPNDEAFPSLPKALIPLMSSEATPKTELPPIPAPVAVAQLKRTQPSVAPAPAPSIESDPKTSYRKIGLSVLLVLAFIGLLYGVYRFQLFGLIPPSGEQASSLATSSAEQDNGADTENATPAPTNIPAIRGRATATALMTAAVAITATDPTITPTIIPDTPTPIPPTATPTPILPLADTASQFSDQQGQDNWQYQWSLGRDSFDWALMEYDGACWLPPNSETSIRICQESAHPGLTGDIAWRWTNSINGPIKVKFTAQKLDTAGGDGVTIHLYRGLRELASWHLEAENDQGIVEEQIIDVAAGDYIFFVIKMNKTPIHDQVAFRAQIFQE